MTRSDRLAALAKLEFDEFDRFLTWFDAKEQDEIATHWELWARKEQLPPEGDWRTWLIMAGRGYGKTRAGAEWVRAVAQRDPQARIALVSASLGEARAVMVEGQSGILEVSPPARRPHFEPSLRRVSWPNGAQALLYSAGEPGALRGPQHSHARRASAEGNLRQRGARRSRCPSSWRRRIRNRHAANRSARRPELAHRSGRHRRMGRS